MESAMLREAIAASLRDQDRRKSSPRTQRGVVDLTRDSDDDSDEDADEEDSDENSEEDSSDEDSNDN